MRKFLDRVLRPITTRLQNRLLSIVLLLVLPTVGASLLAYQNSVSSQQASAEAAQLQFTRTRASSISASLAGLQVNALQLVASPPLVALSQALQDPATGAAPDAATLEQSITPALQVLDTFLRRNATFTGLCILNAQGQETLCLTSDGQGKVTRLPDSVLTDQSATLYFTDAMALVGLSNNTNTVAIDYDRDTAGRPILHYVAALQNLTGQSVGALELKADLKALLHPLDDTQGLYPAGATDRANLYVLDNAGQVVYSQDDGTLAASTVAKAISAPGKGGSDVLRSLPRSIVAYASIQPFEAAQNSNVAWTLVYVTRLDRILAQTTANALTLLGLSLAALLIFGLVSRAMIGGAIRPLRSLADAAGQIAAGNLDAPIPAIQRADEVGTLGAAIVNMEERERRERRRAERLATIRAALSQASDDDDVLAAMQLALDGPADALTLMYIDSDAVGKPETMRLVASTSVVEEPLPEAGYSVAAYPLSHTWIEQPGQLVAIRDVEADRRVDEMSRTLLARFGVRGILLAPLHIAGDWQALLVISWTAPHYLSADESYLVENSLQTAAAIVARRRLVLRTQADAARMLQLSNTKTQFLSTMSHELRTPLNAIIGFANLLLQGSKLPPEKFPAEKRDHFADLILSNARKQLTLINDLLDIAKIEAGRMELNFSHYSPRSMLQRVADEQASQFAAKQIGLHLLLIDAPEMVEGDQARTEQVVLNLLSNALKFTTQGSITVQARTLEADTWSIEVTDTGIGIDPVKRAVIFEPFRQADSGTAREYGGTGLGLALVSNFCRLMGGTIRLADSAPGAGSTFIISLPVRQPDHTPISEPELEGAL